jgi:hypothetical protein
MAKTPIIKLFITGDDERVQEAYEEIYSTYIVDENLVTKGTRDNMTLEFSGDRAVCMVPIFSSPDKDVMLARAWYIISRWDVTSVVLNGLLVRDLNQEIDYGGVLGL